MFSATFVPLRSLMLNDPIVRDILLDIHGAQYRNRTKVLPHRQADISRVVMPDLIRHPVRRTLNKHGYPPDKQQKAIDTVLKQAEVLADYWVEQ